MQTNKHPTNDTMAFEAQIVQRLQVLEDKEALRSLFNRGWRALDQHDWQGWIDCWTDDAEFEFGPWGITQGKEAIRSRVVAAEEAYGAMLHHILNIDFDVQGDRATGTGYMWFVAVPDNARPQDNFAMGGPYEWELVRTDHGWRLSRQRLAVQWSQGEDTLSSST